MRFIRKVSFTDESSIEVVTQIHVFHKIDRQRGSYCSHCFQKSANTTTDPPSSITLSRLEIALTDRSE